jgi:putative phosphoesterase
MRTPPLRIAVLSDTHGLLRPELAPRLAGVHHILHAGDVGDPAILDELRKIAPVTAIRGNIDRSGPCSELPVTEVIELGGCLVYMLHRLDELDLKPANAGIGIVIFGHTHQPSVFQKEGVLYLNPGSIGPRRFSLPISYAILQITDGIPTAELFTL